MATLTPIQIADMMLPNVAGSVGTAVPAATTWILKEIQLYNSGVGVNRVRFRTSLAAADTANFVDQNMAAGAALNLPFNMVLPTGTQLSALVDNANQVHAIVSGVSSV